MGVYIKDLNYPKRCMSCVFAVGNRCVVSGYKDIQNWFYNHVKDPDCPLTKIPSKHGRLIDESEVLQHTESIDDSWGCVDVVKVSDIENCTTIIDAEET